MVKSKNYFILGIVLLTTVIIIGYTLKWYDVYKEEMRNTAVISDTISELKTDEEFYTYISEKNDAVIYFEITDNPNCRSFEKKFKNVIYQYQLKDEIVYISVNNLRGSNFASNLDAKYNNDNLRKQNKYFNVVPAVAIFSNNKLINFVSGDNLTTRKVIKLLEKYDFVNSWE
jgi:hypothetical protein